MYTLDGLAVEIQILRDKVAKLQQQVIDHEETINKLVRIASYRKPVPKVQVKGYSLVGNDYSDE